MLRRPTKGHPEILQTARDPVSSVDVETRFGMIEVMMGPSGAPLLGHFYRDWRRLLGCGWRLVQAGEATIIGVEPPSVMSFLFPMPDVCPCQAPRARHGNNSLLDP